MRVIAAYLLAVLGGNNNPTADDIAKILDSVGIKADDEALEKVVSELKGKDIDALIAAGSSKLATLPSGGGGGSSSGGAAPASGGAAAGGDAPAAKEEKEKTPEEEGDLGFSLFD